MCQLSNKTRLQICLGKGRSARGWEPEHQPGTLPSAKEGLQHLRSFGSDPRGILEFLFVRRMHAKGNK